MFQYLQDVTKFDVRTTHQPLIIANSRREVLFLAHAEEGSRNFNLTRLTAEPNLL
jgi:hypothetical protein